MSDGSEHPIPILEDLERCLPMFPFTKLQRNWIVLYIPHIIPVCIRDYLGKDKIIDADGKTELSIDTLTEKYFSNKPEDMAWQLEGTKHTTL